MTDELEVRRGLGGHFWGNFKSEAVVVRPADVSRSAFQIDAHISKNKYQVPIDAPIYEGDLIERRDPRGGVIEYHVDDVEFHPDPFPMGGQSTDHLTAVVSEKGRAPRSFGSTHIHIAGGSNQVAVGSNGVTMIQSNGASPEWLDALRSIVAGVPGEVSEESAVELKEAVEDAEQLPGDASPNKVKRVLDGVRGVVERIGSAAAQGATGAVTTWSAQASRALLDLIAQIG